MPSIYDWSTVASDNATSDSAINWAEGQAPSTVNNSARVMMQRGKEILNDIGGITAVGGTTNALTLTAASAFTAYGNGLRVSFRAVSDNTHALGFTAAEVYTGTSSANTNYPIGTILVVVGTEVNRSASVTVDYSTSNSTDFVTSGGVSLSGTWRGRGRTASGNTLVQRTA